MIELDENFEIDFEEFLIGEYESDEAESGLTAIFPLVKNTTGISQIGGSPATMSTEVLHPLHRKNASIDALVFTGRSIFGFKAAFGIISSLHHEGKGLKIRHMNVPIVPVAAIFDFVKNSALPDESWGINAYKNRGNKIHVGRHGAGRGATVGKVLGIEHSMPSGQGYDSFRENGLKLSSIVVVNAYGDIYNDKNEIIAGTRIGNKFLNSIKYLEKSRKIDVKKYYNTTIAAVLTNAKLDKEEACKLSELVNLAIGSRIKPYNTQFDGDSIFTISTNKVKEPFEKIAAIAQKITLNAIEKIFI